MEGILAVFTALAVLVVGRIAERLFLEPIIEQWRLKGETSYSLYFYAQAFVTPNASSDEAIKTMSQAFRKLAGEFKRNRNAIPFYRFSAFVRLVTPSETLEKVVGNLTGISNTSKGDRNWGSETADAIRKGLKIT